MPRFKTTYNILTVQDQDELFDENWMDRETIFLPPKSDWDYKRELRVEDVAIWEVILELNGGWGLYASWDPYAEFYLLTNGTDTRQFHFVNGQPYQSCNFETFYGPKAGKQVYEILKKHGISLPLFTHWVDDEQMWLYEEQQKTKSLII